MLDELRRSRARRRLDFIGDMAAAIIVASVPKKPPETKEYLAVLAITGYQGDDDTLADIMSAIQR